MPNLKEKWKLYQWYAIIGMLSAVAVFFLPMLGTTADLQFLFPNTLAGWVVYITTKIFAIILNVLIFHSFIQQGVLNIKDNPYYIEAMTILNRYGIMLEDEPRSPEEWKRDTYGKKGVSLAITTALSAIGLTQAVLTFDLTAMLTYIFTVFMGVIFGLIQMNATEDYHTGELWRYAKKIEKLYQSNSEVPAGEGVCEG